MRKEDLRIAAGLTTNMIANMGKEGKNISKDTLARICETPDCGILDVIELASDEPSVTENRKNNGKNIKIFCCTKHMALDILKSERNIMIQEIRKADKINVNHGIL